MSELQREIDHKRDLEERGIYGNIQDSKVVKDLRRNLNIAEADLKKNKSALGQARTDFKNLTLEH